MHGFLASQSLWLLLESAKKNIILVIVKEQEIKLSNQHARNIHAYVHIANCANFENVKFRRIWEAIVGNGYD